MFDKVNGPLITQLLVGFILSSLVCYFAWRMKALTSDGSWAAVIIGGIIFGLGGLSWAVLLLTFFVSSSVLSRVFINKKADLSEKFAKGVQRDSVQVFANGGLGALLATTQVFAPDQHWPWISYAGTVATVNADTWATELGALSSKPPRLITTGQRVERGTSGGITFLGTLASLCGASLIALLGELVNPQVEFGKTLLIVSLAGLAGSLLDSMLGATVQIKYRCPRCSTETEHHPLHTCGEPTVPLSGWRWLNNDAVNFTSSIFGAAVATVLWFF